MDRFEHVNIGADFAAVLDYVFVDEHNRHKRLKGEQFSAKWYTFFGL